MNTTELIAKLTEAHGVSKAQAKGSPLKGVGKSEFGGGLAIAQGGSRLA